DDIGRGLDANMAAQGRVGSGTADDRLVRADRGGALAEVAADEDHRGRRALGRRVELRQCGDELPGGRTTAGRTAVQRRPPDRRGGSSDEAWNRTRGGGLFHLHLVRFVRSV